MFTPKVGKAVTYIDSKGRRRPAVVVEIVEPRVFNLRLGHYARVNAVTEQIEWNNTGVWYRTNIHGGQRPNEDVLEEPVDPGWGWWW